MAENMLFYDTMKLEAEMKSLNNNEPVALGMREIWTHHTVCGNKPIAGAASSKWLATVFIWPVFELICKVCNMSW